MSLGRAAALVASLGLAGAVGAEPLVLDVDASASAVGFEVGATLHTVEGVATILPGGRILLDPETGEAAGSVRIDARSLDTGIHARDTRLHADVLESGIHPKIVFYATGIEVSNRSAREADFVLRGELEIHGAHHPVSLAGHVRGDVPGVARASATATLPYVAWGMRDVSSFLLRVAKQVEVRLEIVGDLTRADPVAPAPAR